MEMRWISLLLVFLLLNSLFVSATLRLDPLPSTEFNLGDQVVVSGTIISDKTQRVYLTLDLVCASDSSQLFVKLMDLKKGLEASFSRLAVIPTISAPADCKIVASLSDGGTLLEKQESAPFRVSRELNGAFDLVNSVYQLGDTINIRGGITKLDGTPLNGVAMLFFKKDAKTVLVETGDIINGDLAIDKELNLMPTGAYVVAVEASDSVGNRHLFEEAFGFDLIGSLNLEVTSEKDIYMPGSNLVLKGIARSSVADSILEGVKVIASFGDTEFVQDLTGNTFDFIYQLPSNIKSGAHDMKLVVKDEDGNYGEQQVSFSVNAVPTTLSMKAGNSEFKPGEKVDFDVLLFDQADDPVGGSVILNVYDHEGKVRAEQNIVVNKKATFTLPEQAPPGIWKIALNGFGLNTEQSFVIKEVKKLDVVVENGKFKLKNIGNVEFDAPVNFIAGGVEKIKEIVLSPNQEQEIELTDLFEAGTYDIEVPIAEKIFSGVIVPDEEGFLNKIGLGGITGKAVGTKGEGSLLSVVLVIGFILISLMIGGVVIFRGRSDVPRPHVHINSNRDGWESEYALGQRRVKELRKVEEDKPARKYKYDYGKATEADIQDFKRRMVNTIREEEENRKKFASRKWQSDPTQQQSSGVQLGGSRPEFEVRTKEEDSPYKRLFG